MTAGFSPLVSSAFSAVFRKWMKTRFSEIHIRAPSANCPVDVPLMVVANHASWWDGFLLLELQRRVRPGVPSHTVMLESELKQHPFLERLGAVAIDPDSPSSIRRCIREVKRRVEERPESMIFFFPQGRIRPSWRRPLGFKRGVYLFCEALGDVMVMPAAIHIEPVNSISPHAFVHAGEPFRYEANCPLSTFEYRVETELDGLLSLLC